MFDGISSGSGEIWLRNIQCPSDAYSISQCNNPDFEHVDDLTLNETCTHESDVGIKCGKLRNCILHALFCVIHFSTFSTNYAS